MTRYPYSYRFVLLRVPPDTSAEELIDMAANLEKSLQEHIVNMVVRQKASDMTQVGDSHLMTKARPRFTNGFSIAIQIRWKFRFALTSI